MSHVNKTEHNPKEVPQKNQHAAVSKNLLQSFNNLFDRAQSNTMPSEDASEQTNRPTATPLANKEPDEQVFQFDQNERHFQHFFPELGISTIQHIEKIIISVTQAIEKTQATPTNEIFLIALKDQNHPFQINLSKKNQQLNIKLTCDPTLHQLLSKYLPELKLLLKKKSINVNIIQIEADEELSLPPQLNQE